jgi:hypothetical protein
MSQKLPTPNKLLYWSALFRLRGEESRAAESLGPVLAQRRIVSPCNRLTQSHFYHLLFLLLSALLTKRLVGARRRASH